ncbi:MAG: glutaminyl-peptide cyclotransferase, partial [Actinomycetota bacterium]|nr:glutaminyl-peptide cyclotransferase [Actinomycetota bacterium]
ADASWVPEVVARIPHDPGAFTQGLVVDGDVVWESTGLYGQSTLRRADRHTGEVLATAALDDALFGEGLELVGDRLVQLTWQEETALVWDSATLEQVDTFAYDGEGWGLCQLDDDRLVMSDGTATLTVRHPVTFESIDEIEVSRDGQPVTDLNELECVDGLVFANVWLTDEIVVIGDDGSVVATVDAAALDAELVSTPGRDVLNGIAHDPTTGTFLLTGKLWPTTFEVRFVPAPGAGVASLPRDAEEVRLDVDGVARRYLRFVPDGIEGETPVPLVIDLHGFTVDPERHAVTTHWDQLAAAEGFAVATPAAVGDPVSWATASGAISAPEVEFLVAVVEDMAATVPIDPDRVFVSGYSNGGGMAHRLACERADLVAAIGTVAGAYIDAAACDPTQPVSVISFHGTADLVARYDGVSDVFPPIADWAEAWAERNGCAPVPARSEVSADTVADTWSGCDAGAEVALYTVQGGNHAWPGAEVTGVFTPTDTIDATALMWEFFQNHTR